MTKPTEKVLVATPKLVDNGSYFLETEEGNAVALTATIIQANVPDLSHTTASLECGLFTALIFFANSTYVTRLYIPGV